MNARTIVGFAMGPVATAAISLVTVPLVAWAFSADDVGRFSLFQLSVSFVVLFSSLGLDQGYVREYHESGDRAVLLRSAFYPPFLAGCLLALVALVVATPLARALFDITDPRATWLLVTASFAALVARLLSLVLRMEERSFAFSASQVLPKLALLIVLVPVSIVAVNRDFFLLGIALLLSWLTAAVVTAWSTHRAWTGARAARVDRELVARLLRYSLPLVLAGLGYWALTAAGALSLRTLSSLAELGVYSVALSFAGAAVVVQTIFSVVWAPVVYHWAATEQDMTRVDRLTTHLLAIVALLFCGVGALSFLLDFVLPAGYDSVKYLVLATIAAPLLYTLSEVTGIGINLTRRTGWSIGATLLSLVVSVMLNVLLVPGWGARGAVLATMAAYLVFLLARTEASRHLWRPFPRARTYATVIALCGLAAATVLLGPGTGRWYAVAWTGLVPIVLILFRRQWPELAQAIRSARSEP